MSSTRYSGGRVSLVVMLVASTILSRFFRVSNGVSSPEVMRDLSMRAPALGFAGTAFFVALAVMQRRAIGIRPLSAPAATSDSDHRP